MINSSILPYYAIITKKIPKKIQILLECGKPMHIPLLGDKEDVCRRKQLSIAALNKLQSI